MAEAAHEPLIVEVADGIAVVRLNRPEQRNALSRELIDALNATFERLGHDAEVHVVVLTGNGGAFCSGLDLRELGDEGTNLDGSFIEALRALPQPTIAAIEGPAVTAGIEIALACDIRLASPTAVFADTHVRVGVLQGGGASVLIARIIGVGRAKEMSLSGRFVAADEAERWGLVNRVVEDDVLEAAFRLAREITANDPRMVQKVKALIDDGLDRGVRDALAWERDQFVRFSRSLDTATVSQRRDRVIDRGRQETGSVAQP